MTSNCLRALFPRFSLLPMAVISVGLTLSVPAWAGQAPAVPAVPAAVPAAAAAPQATGPTLDLTMDRAVEMALEANLGMKASRLDIDAADAAIASARAAFLPQVGSTLTRGSQTSPPSDFTQGSNDVSSETFSFGAQLGQVLPGFGTRYDLSWNNNRREQIGGVPIFNPSLQSSFQIVVTQPLLRGFLTDQNRTALRTSQRRRAVADLQLEQEIVRMQSVVQFAYLDLISAREGLRVAQLNLEIRQTSLADARARVAVGAAAPIDLISAEAEVASNTANVLVAEALIATREDNLRTLILDPARPDYWDVHINPIDTVQSELREIDLDAAIQNALANRLDLIAARQTFEINQLNLRTARDATRPAVDLRASYASSGNGGTQFRFENFEQVGEETRSYSSVLKDTFGAAYPQWSLGVTVAYPLGRSAADANFAQQQVAQRQSQLTIAELELAVVRQIRDAARQIQNIHQRVLVQRAALAANEQQLEAEQRRFAAGLSTTLELQVRQGQLSAARQAELDAVIAYNRALIDFKRVQKTQ